MSINEILSSIGMTKYRLAKLSGVPNATLSELCSGKTNIAVNRATTATFTSKVNDDTKQCNGHITSKNTKTPSITLDNLLFI